MLRRRLPHLTLLAAVALPLLGCREATSDLKQYNQAILETVPQCTQIKIAAYAEAIRTRGGNDHAAHYRVLEQGFSAQMIISALVELGHPVILAGYASLEEPRVEIQVELLEVLTQRARAIATTRLTEAAGQRETLIELRLFGDRWQVVDEARHSVSCP